MAWERLRIVYNAILTAITLIAGWDRLGDILAWLLFIVAAVGANLCFCVGPIAEGYFDLLSMPRRQARRRLFITGTLLAVAITFITVGGHKIPFHFGP